MTLEKEKNVEKKGFLLIPLLVLMLTQCGTSADNGILGVATNSLIVALNATMADIQLANLVYSLCAGAFMVVGGMLGIIYGWKNIYRIGVVLAAVGEFFLAISTNVTMFTWGGRFLVGIGASFMIPAVLGMIPALYSGKDRIFAFGAIGAAAGIASAAGPILAGILLDTVGFRIAFGAMAVYFVVLFAGSFLIPAIARSETKLKLDVVGIIVATAGLFLFLVGMSKVSVWGLIEPIDAPFTIFGISPALPAIVLGLIILACLVVVERKIEEKNGCALIPRSFLQTPQVRSGLVGSAIIFLYLGGQVMLVNSYLQVVGGFSAVQTGLALMFMGLPMFLCSMGVPKLLPSVHPRTIMRIGYLVLSVAILPMIFSLRPDGVNALMYVGLVLAGVGQGLISSQTSGIVTLAINNRDAQQSGGLQATCRNVGQAFGVAVLGMVMLFTLHAGFTSTVVKQADVSPDVISAVDEKRIAFMSDSQFTDLIADVEMTDAEKDALLAANAQARISSTQKALAVLAVIILAGELTTGAITITKRKEA